MTTRAAAIGGLLVISLLAGTWRDRAPAQEPVMLGGYHVLAVDFHVHTHPLSSTTLTSWDVVTEARRARLDAIAVVPHDHVWAARLARWFSRLIDGPIVLVGEEVAATQCDVLAVGIERTIPWGQRARAVAEQAHAQGGIAIAAHPVQRDWHGCAEAVPVFDGSEIVHPLVFNGEDLARSLRDFNASGDMAAIGDTDYHIGQFGMVRTYVFARERSAAAILDAVRAKRTVVYDRGRVYGERSLIQLAAADGRLPRMAALTGPRRLATLDGAIAIVGLLAAILFGWRDDR